MIDYVDLHANEKSRGEDKKGGKFMFFSLEKSDEQFKPRAKKSRELLCCFWRYFSVDFIFYSIMQELKKLNSKAWTESNKREKQILNFPGSWTNKKRVKLSSQENIFFPVFLFGNENSCEFILPFRHRDRKERKDTPFSRFKREIEARTYFLRRKKS